MANEDRNPESELDRRLLEAFQSGEYVKTGRGIQTREKAEGRKKQADDIRNLVLMTLVALTTYGGATGLGNNRMGSGRMSRREYKGFDESRRASIERSNQAQVALGERLQWQPSEGYGQLRGNVGGLLGRHRPSGIGDPGLYRSSGGMSVPEDVLKAIEAVSRQAFKGVITPEELRVALWEIERRATPLGLSTRIGGPYRGGAPPGGILN